MGDEPSANEAFHQQGGSSQQSYFRNNQPFHRGPRRQKWTQHHTGDKYYFQHNNSRVGVDEPFFLRQIPIQYQSQGEANIVNNYRGKRYERGYGRFKGNSSRYKSDGHFNDSVNFSNTDCESYVDETISGEAHPAEEFTVMPEAAGTNDSEVKGTSGCSSAVREDQGNDTRDQRGYVVGGRYMRKNVSSRNESNTFYSNSDQKYSFNSTATGLSSRTDAENNPVYGRSQRSSHSKSSPRENQRGYSYSRGRQKAWYGTKAERRSQTPDLNDNFLGSTETELQNSYTQNVSFHSSPGPCSKLPHQKDQNSSNQKFPVRAKSQYSTKVCVEEDEATQRDRLTLQLQKGECECMVCCESIRSRDQIWHCSSCYHVFHLRCIRKWARSPAALVEDSGWRCPACQNVTSAVPFSDFCFCGKHKDPEVSHHLTPHSCGEVCGKERPDEMCPHRCNILCHPGPCPPCAATITRQCGCGRSKKTVPCRQQSSLCCDSVCGKSLNCGVHSCESICHPGDCQPCSVILTQVCFCGKAEQQLPCTQETSSCPHFGCDSICGKKLTCDQHYCEDICHPGPCGLCALLPSYVERCPCGKTPLKWLYDKNEALVRKTCLDPVPVCNATCNKVLKCGPKENPHTCESKCHVGECPPCSLTTVVKCRCGSVTKELACAEYVLQNVFLCEKRCSRRKDCGRHKCLALCCVGLDHICELVCNKKLNCGIHQCEGKCHMGNCPPCRNVSFDELTCHCGSSVLYPPIHCGTKPPECKKPCTRIQQCEHPPKHYCHSEVSCPPCAVLTVKWCFGKHMQRKNVQCFLDGISCGLPCGKPLPCNVHKCQETCHEGPCLKNNAQCTQPCSALRPDCDHPCSAPCHAGPCPDTPCKTKMNVSCPCGNRTELVACSDNNKSYQLMSMSVLASKMRDIKLGQSVNMSDVLGKKGKNNRLQCNEECAVLERNKRLAVALQIQNPDLSCKPGPPSYSEFLKEETKKSPQFVLGIYEKLTDLVHLAKESKKKSRSHAFPPMNRDQRRVVYELAEFFGCESQSYDEEPKKSVTVTAYKDKSWLPFVSIITVVQREMGQRKGPTPVISRADTKAGAPSAQQKERTIDYFDFKEES